MPSRVPVVISIDVEPDDRIVDPTARPRWYGFEAMLPEIRRFRAQLAKASGVPVHFTWLVRLDHQIERAYGRADWGLEQYRREFDELRSAGDIIGAHAHSWRWDDVETTWVADHGDPRWVEHCVQLTLESFRRHTGQRARVFSHGDEFLSNAIVRQLERLGVHHDLTIAPGNQPQAAMVAGERATGSLPDYRGLPRVPYRPSVFNYRRPAALGRRGLWLLPVTTDVVVNPYAADPTPANHNLLVGAPLEVNRTIFECYRAAFPQSVVLAVARSDVFLNGFNGEQFRGFIDYLAEQAHRQRLTFASPQEAIRLYGDNLGCNRFGLARYAAASRHVQSNRVPPPPIETAAADDPDQAMIRSLLLMVQQLHQRLQQMERSRTWRLRRRLLRLRSILQARLSHGQRTGLLRQLRRFLFMPGRPNLRWALKHLFRKLYLWLEDEAVDIVPRRAAEPPTVQIDPYERWLARHTPQPSELREFRQRLDDLAYQPRISILLPVFNPPVEFFRQAVQSVLRQIYPNWELCIADDASTDPAIRAALAEFAQQDPRIQVVHRRSNGHISAASNSALALATGEFCALLDHDDLLAPDALYHNVLALNERRDLDVLYSDEDKLDQDGRRVAPHFKPDWSPDTLLTGNYITHLLVARTELIRVVGGFREGYEGAQDYDLILRLTEQSERIHHVPQVLYHWRQHAESTAHTHAAKPYAYQAGLRALRDALTRRGEPGRVTLSSSGLGHYDVRYELRPAAPVSIIIPTRDQAAMLDTCLRGLFESTRHHDFEVLVMDNGSRERRTFELFEQYAARYPGRFATRRDNGDFNFSRLINAGAAAARHPYLLLLNNDVRVQEPDWLTAMLEHAQRPAVGCVGARLLYPDGTVQHAGVIVSQGPTHVFRHAERDAAVYMQRLTLTTNYSAVTAACLLVRRQVFEQVGGFDERFAVDYNDVDFCLRVRAAGYHNLVAPAATLCHHEQFSRGHIHSTAESARRHADESARFQERWLRFRDADPCVGPYLQPRDGDLRLVG